MSCSVKCGGICCRSFTLPKPHDTYTAKRAEILAWLEAGGAIEADDPETAWMADYLSVSEMIIPLPDLGDGVHRYTCNRFDDATGLCSRYDERPAMCRDYPGYGRNQACGYCGFREQPAGLLAAGNEAA